MIDPKNDGQPATSLDLLRVDQILSQIVKDLEIHFQLHESEMKHPEAKLHFQQRAALQIVRNLVIDKGERLAMNQD